MKKVYYKTMDTNISQRLLEIRKLKDRNQSQFANDLQMTQASISKMEAGLTPITEKTIKLICLAFNINEAWLRNGEGDMFISDASQEEAKFMDIYRKLSPINQKMLLEFAITMLANEQPDPA
jgi:transcriptional regulator with XRE-family HTH domain